MKIPNYLRKEVDKLKDQTVEDIYKNALITREKLQEYKDLANKNIDSYMDLLAQEYGIHYEGKGNLTLTNTEGTIKISREIHDFIVFDEKLQVAKSLIDECIKKWSNGANENIKALVDHAFQVDKKGKVNTDRVLSLRKLDINDEDWERAMQAISDSLQISRTKMYIRIHRREDEYGKWEPLILDIATI